VKQNSTLFRDVKYLAVANTLTKPLEFIKSFMVVKYLGPELYGVLKSVEVIRMLNKFGTLGFNQAVIRNATHAQSKGDVHETTDIKNNAYSAEIILSLVLLLAGLSSSFFFEEELIVVAIILSSISLFTAKLLGIFTTELQFRKKFKRLGRVTIYQSTINAVLVIISIPFFGIYPALIVPSVSAIIVILITYSSLKSFFDFKLNKKSFIKISRVSIPLSLNTISFGVFRITEKTLIIKYLGLTAVGLFGFAETIVGIFTTIMLSSVMKVKTMQLYEELGKSNYTLVHKIALRETIILVIVSLFAMMLAVFALYNIIPIILPEWESALFITFLYGFVLPLKFFGIYVAVIIKSTTVNKIHFTSIVYILSTLFLISGTVFLNYNDALSLQNFIILDLFAYFIVHASQAVYYYYVFFLKFVKLKVFD